MVKILPALDWDIGFPQLQRVAITDPYGTLTAYDFLWRWNEFGESSDLICDVRRVAESVVMWRGVVQKLNPFEVKDPVRYDVQFTVLPRENDKSLELLEIWIFEE